MNRTIDEDAIATVHPPLHDLVRCDFGSYVMYRCLFCRFELQVVEGGRDAR